MTSVFLPHLIRRKKKKKTKKSEIRDVPIVGSDVFKGHLYVV